MLRSVFGKIYGVSVRAQFCKGLYIDAMCC